jgi:hypothetical protein
MAVKAMSSVGIMHSKACMAMFLRPLTLCFSRFRFSLSLETTLSIEALKCVNPFQAFRTVNSEKLVNP